MGINHALALTSKGTVYIWGSGEQNQLGRKVMVRSKLQALLPWEFGNMKHIVDIGCGADHSFAISEQGDVYSWGLNSFGQTGIAANAGEDAAVTAAPTIIKSLRGHGRITCITGGNHNSIAATDRGECVVWGRLDCFTSGLDLETLPESDGIVRDERNRPRILLEPTPIPGIDAHFVAAGSDHCLAITKDHKVFTWGFNTDRQTGQKGDDDIKVATLLEHPSISGKQLVWAGAGGQYSMLGITPVQDGVMANGNAK
jgi:regulator of chromosome condensation